MDLEKTTRKQLAQGCLVVSPSAWILGAFVFGDFPGAGQLFCTGPNPGVVFHSIDYVIAS